MTKKIIQYIIYIASVVVAIFLSYLGKKPISDAFTELKVGHLLYISIVLTGTLLGKNLNLGILSYVILNLGFWVFF